MGKQPLSNNFSTTNHAVPRRQMWLVLWCSIVSLALLEKFRYQQLFVKREGRYKLPLVPNFSLLLHKQTIYRGWIWPWNLPWTDRGPYHREADSHDQEQSTWPSRAPTEPIAHRSSAIDPPAWRFEGTGHESIAIARTEDEPVYPPCTLRFASCSDLLRRRHSRSSSPAVRWANIKTRIRNL